MNIISLLYINEIIPNKINIIIMILIIFFIFLFNNTIIVVVNKIITKQKIKKPKNTSIKLVSSFLFF
jgi:hypothetical protein